MQTIVKQNIISLQSNGRHCLCTIWHPGSNTGWSGHLNAALAQVLFHLLEEYTSNGTFSSARQQQSAIVHRKAPATPEQGNLHLRRSEKSQAHITAQLHHLLRASEPLPPTWEIVRCCLVLRDLQNKKSQNSILELPVL